jgi:hypothetical protein
VFPQPCRSRRLGQGKGSGERQWRIHGISSRSARLDGGLEVTVELAQGEERRPHDGGRLAVDRF